MLILVTGLDGFTGKYVQAELAENGHTVYGLTSDLTDQASVSMEIAEVGPEAVIHLAGISFVGHGDANAFYEVNLIGTRNLLEALAELAPNIQSVLLTSSANIYGNQAEGSVTENVLPNPANDYAVSKLAMEHMARIWSNKLPLCIVRPFNYTGVDQDERFLIPKIVNHFKENLPVIELGNLDVWREFGDVRVVSNIYRKLVEIAPVGKVFNVCTGKAYSIREVVSICEEITGHCIDIKVNPQFVRSNEVRELSGNCSLLENYIGRWDIINLEDTLEWMLESG